jgi:uncharacterized protein YdgA (DUF945 family)
VKKGIVVLLVLLAVVVLVSPAIVGRLAERSMDENLNWAASESGDLTVTSQHFARGWFSSEGQHRIELQEGDVFDALQVLAGPMAAEDVPVLVINTRLDHGLIPLASMGRDKGSLSPGLGSAISTLQIELPDGQIIDVPGTIFSKVALGGNLHSNYVLAAGSREAGEVSGSWGGIDVDVTTDPASGEIAFQGSIDSFAFTSDKETVSLDTLRFEGRQAPTRFGVSVGDLDVSLGGLSIGGSMGDGTRLSELEVQGSSSLHGDRIRAGGRASMKLDGLPLGALSYRMEFSLDDVDAAALGALQDKVSGLGSDPDPMAAYATVESDARALFAAGFDFDIDRLDVTLPQGTMTTVMKFRFAKGDPASFDWSSLLLNTEGSIDLSVPAALIETFAQGNPQIAMVIGGGYLVRRGDDYVMEARLKKGLLTVNGAPIPIPLGVP